MFFVCRSIIQKSLRRRHRRRTALGRLGGWPMDARTVFETPFCLHYSGRCAGGEELVKVFRKLCQHLQAAFCSPAFRFALGQKTGKILCAPVAPGSKRNKTREKNKNLAPPDGRVVAVGWRMFFL